MNLGQFRALLVEETGRYDLIENDGSNRGGEITYQGANGIINRAHKLLDRAVNTLETDLWYVRDIAKASRYLLIQYCRSIKKVWVVNSSDGRTALTKKSPKWILDNYTKTEANIDEGTPQYFAPVRLTLAPQQKTLNTTNYTDQFTYDFSRFVFENDGDEQVYKFGYNSILFMPPADGVYTMEVLGTFKSLEVSKDTDETFWLSEEWDLLLTACRAVLESQHSNFQRTNDWERFLMDTLGNLDKDRAEEECDDEDSCMNG